MEKIPTAEELLKINHLLIEKNKTCEAHTHLVVKQMIEFAKLHVQKALEQASQLEETDGTEGYKIYPSSILNAYPLENIK